MPITSFCRRIYRDEILEGGAGQPVASHPANACRYVLQSEKGILVLNALSEVLKVLCGRMPRLSIRCRHALNETGPFSC